jgi:hypothetical protein
MTNSPSVAELGPVDYLVLEFPGSQFNGNIAPALADLVERNIVRVLDIVVVKKDADGSVAAFELSDLHDTEVGNLRGYEDELALLLNEEDVAAIGATLLPGSSAGVLVWENTWAAPFAVAVRQSGGQMVASGRIPVDTLLAVIEADQDDETTEES